VIASDWYERPLGDPLTLPTAPRLASWNKSTHPDQVKLRQYLDQAEALLGERRPVTGPWALRLEVGLPAGQSLLDMADLDNYALPLAKRLNSDTLVSVWASKRHATDSCIIAAPARKTPPPNALCSVRTTASVDSVRYKEQVREGLADVAELPAGPVRLQIALTVGPRRTWLNLWKPTIDALDPLLGRTSPDRLWHPKDGRIIELGLHLTTNNELGNDVQIFIAAERATEP
jgi:hypothetical protein